MEQEENSSKMLFYTLSFPGGYTRKALLKDPDRNKEAGVQCKQDL